MLLYHPTWLAVNRIAPGRVRKNDPGLPLATRVPRETAERHVSASAPRSPLLRIPRAARKGTLTTDPSVQTSDQGGSKRRAKTGKGRAMLN